MSDLVIAKTFPKRYEAELAKGLLADEGIEATLSIDDMGGFAPYLLLTRGRRGMAKLLVKKEDLEKAQDIFKRLDDPSQ